MLTGFLDAAENLGTVEIEVEFGEEDGEENEEDVAEEGNGEGEAEEGTAVRPIRSGLLASMTICTYTNKDSHPRSNSSALRPRWTRADICLRLHVTRPEP